MSTQTVSQTAVLPEGIEPLVVAPRDLLPSLKPQMSAHRSQHFGAARVEAGDEYWIDFGPDPVVTPSRVGEAFTMPSGEPATWLGTYEVLKVTRDTVVGQLVSEIVCSAFPWEQCTGHDIEGDAIYQPDRHVGPSVDVATLLGQATIYVSPVIDAGRPLLELDLPPMSGEHDQAGLLRLCDDLEALVGELRTIASEMDGRE